ncbi:MULTISPECIES: flavin reductase family protein [unclassified Streptomyces]|uniref:flavin reductase family protein n=1 Tax=unclassified Streptomyces TaxID=2593676 RepID=UPI0033DC9CA5
MSFDDFTTLVDSPVYVVTASAGGRRAGCLVGFASQCSLEPARFVVWLSTANHTYLVAREATVLAVHLLPQDHDLAVRFGARCGAEVNKFDGLAWTEGPYGTPLLAEAAAWFTGEILERFDGGDHIGFLLAPLSVQVNGGTPLSLHQTLDITAGHPA